MNKTLADAQHFATSLSNANSHPRIQRFVIPPFTSVRQVKAMLTLSDIMVGAQNMHWTDEGAWTGEISSVMLTDCALDMIELGHSERRTHLCETDDTVARKNEAAVRHGLIPLICIGDTAEDKTAGRATDVLCAQVETALGQLTRQQHTAPIILAYEPVWAIGAHGKPATPAYANEQQSLGLI